MIDVPGAFGDKQFQFFNVFFDLFQPFFDALVVAFRNAAPTIQHLIHGAEGVGGGHFEVTEVMG